MVSKTWFAAFASAYLYTLVQCDCESFGVDFQNGGTYFQNSLSTDPFTALQEFEGCQNDTAHNVIVDPQGDQSECSETPLTPDDVPQLITCSQWPKDTLYNGEWSLLIISNNGDGNPIAYQRDFSLTVGPQQTVTGSVTQTITGGSAGTQTLTPAPLTTSITSGLLEFTVTSTSTQSTTTTTLVQLSCSTTPTSSQKDAIATVLPSILGNLNSVASSIIHGNSKRAEPTALPLLAKFKKSLLEGKPAEADARAEFLAARKASLQKLAKRAPDLQTITVTPAPVYVQATVTAVGVTVTKTQTVLFYLSTVTSTSVKTLTSTIKTAASGAATSCASVGGTLV